MSNADNPYAAPQAPLDPRAQDFVDLSDAERIRREYINHETSVRSISTLFYLMAIVPGILFLGFARQGEPVPTIAAAVAALLIVAFGTAVRQLQRWTRVPIVILALVGFVGVPIGPVIGAYVLYLVLGKKGRFVYSPDYAAIILQTPEVHYRTPAALRWTFVLIVLGLLSLLLLPTVLPRLR